MGMMEVGTAWAGWSGAQPDGRRVCLLLIFPCTISPEVLFWHRLTRVIPANGHKMVVVRCGKN